MRQRQQNSMERATNSKKRKDPPQPSTINEDSPEPQIPQQKKIKKTHSGIKQF
jgi:hypothetical protein